MASCCVSREASYRAVVLVVFFKQTNGTENYICYSTYKTAKKIKGIKYPHIDKFSLETLGGKHNLQKLHKKVKLRSTGM